MVRMLLGTALTAFGLAVFGVGLKQKQFSGLLIGLLVCIAPGFLLLLSGWRSRQNGEGSLLVRIIKQLDEPRRNAEERSEKLAQRNASCSHEYEYHSHSGEHHFDAWYQCVRCGDRVSVEAIKQLQASCVDHRWVSAGGPIDTSEGVGGWKISYRCRKCAATKLDYQRSGSA
jgi:hypothetical protein